MKIYKVKVNGKVYEVELESVTENSEKIASQEVKAAQPEKVAPAQPKATNTGKMTPLKAPMQGTILKINKAVGDSVKKGEVLAVLEAMKLENDIVSPADGVICEIKVSKGQTVNNQEVILIIG